jgi:glucose-6-phosphate-specific signal transduction histidine kinase
MELKFFPHERQFWYCHAGAMAMVAVLTLLSAVLWKSLAAHVVVTTLLWMLPYTVAVLAFRWVYECRAWQSMPLGRLVPVVLAYATAAGIVSVAAVTLAAAPFYWQEMYTPYMQTGLKLSPFQYMLRNAMSGGLQCQLLICGWIFAYIGISRSGRAYEAELLNGKLNASLKEAQLASLASQLNPHFLFNALNNIRFMVYENAQQAETNVLALSEILRYSLERGRHEKVALDEELDIVRRYITIAKTQYEDRLSFAMHVADGVGLCRVPPMALQLLVENAVKHGIDDARDGGRLQVEAYEEERQLILRVTNDVPAGGARAGRVGIGLRNIRERLALVYGGRAALNCTRSGTEFAAQIALPVERVS